MYTLPTYDTGWCQVFKFYMPTTSWCQKSNMLYFESLPFVFTVYMLLQMVDWLNKLYVQ